MTINFISEDLYANYMKNLFTLKTNVVGNTFTNHLPNKKVKGNNYHHNKMRRDQIKLDPY